MPAMMFFFSSVMPSGLVLYWTISNIWGIVQYIIINRKPALLGSTANAPNPPPNTKKSKVVDAKIVKK
jgi:YidC/Oxa1 family membrane protein insertase